MCQLYRELKEATEATLATVDLDLSAFNLLVKAVVVHRNRFIIRLDLDTEGVWYVACITITGPDLELEPAFAIDSARPLKLGIIASSHNEPLVFGRVDLRLPALN